MPAVNLLLKCACGAQLELVLDGEESASELHNRIRKDARRWQKLHTNHPAQPPRRAPLGFNTHAVAHERLDGEGWGEWDGMYAAPAGEDDDD